MSDHATVSLANRAKEVLGNPAYQEAFIRYEKRVIDLLRSTDDREEVMIRTLKRHLTTLSVVRKNLDVMIQDGMMAEQNLDLERQTLAQRARNALRIA